MNEQLATSASAAPHSLVADFLERLDTLDISTRDLEAALHDPTTMEDISAALARGRLRRTPDTLSSHSAVKESLAAEELARISTWLNRPGAQHHIQSREELLGHLQGSNMNRLEVAVFILFFGLGGALRGCGVDGIVGILGEHYTVVNGALAQVRSKLRKTMDQEARGTTRPRLRQYGEAGA